MCKKYGISKYNLPRTFHFEEEIKENDIVFGYYWKIGTREYIKLTDGDMVRNIEIKELLKDEKQNIKKQ